MNEVPPAAGRPAWLGRTVPWWCVGGLGLASAVIGAVLIGQPFRSLTVLVWLTATALALAGVGELFAARASGRPWLARLVAVVLIITAIVVLSWPSISIFALAVAAGAALVIRGVSRLADAWFGAPVERWIGAMTGLASVMLGLVALSWPAVTVLVLALVFGVAALVFGIWQMVVGWRLRDETGATKPGATASADGSRWSARVRVAGALGAFVLAAGAVAASVAVHRSQPGEPGAFYTAPSPVPAEPAGTILRKEVIPGFQPGATTWRVLYLSTGFDGEPAAVSGLVVVPDAPAPPGGRKILAYTHGTVGVASRCGPSLQGHVWADFMRSEGMTEFVDAGYVIAATDYQGLGTGGPHPYLIGTSEAMNELDNVRAARSLPEAQAGADVGIWGHSQGGHAALFSGQLASTYSPELHIVGVAAGAPVPDLVALFKANLDTTIGKILISMALQSWARVYDTASLDQIVTPTARPIVAKIAGNCLYSAVQIIGSVPSSLALDVSFLSNPPWQTEPWSRIVAENNPGRTALEVPVLLTQGAADPIVPPAETRALAQRMCTNGDQVELTVLEGVGHLDGGPAAVATVTAWMAQRFAGVPAPAGCDQPAALGT